LITATEPEQQTATTTTATTTPIFPTAPAGKSPTKITTPNIAKKNTLSNTDTNKVPEVETPKPTPPPVVTEPEVTEPTLFVSAGEQPKQTLLLATADRILFTTIEMTAKGGDIDISSLTIERRGMGSDRIFTEVGVVDVDSERAINANHQYSTHKTFTIKDGETQEIVLFGNITDQVTLADYNSQAPSLALVGIKTEAKISGSLPIVGTQHIVNSNLTIGSLELTGGGMDPGMAKNIDIGGTNITFAGVRATASGAEQVLLQSFYWYQNGSISRFDLANVKTCVSYKSAINCYDAEPDDNGRYYGGEFGDGIKIDKGDSADIYIKGDVLASGVNRTVDFDINSSYDVLAYGLSYKNFFYSFYGGEEEGAQAEGVFSLSEGPLYNAYAHNVLGGSFTNIGR